MRPEVEITFPRLLRTRLLATRSPTLNLICGFMLYEFICLLVLEIGDNPSDAESNRTNPAENVEESGD